MPHRPHRPWRTRTRRILVWTTPLAVFGAVLALLVVTGVLPSHIAAELGTSARWFVEEAIFPLMGAAVAVLFYRLAG